MRIQIELLGDEFSDGDLLDLDGDVGPRSVWINPSNSVVVLQAITNELSD